MKNPYRTTILMLGLMLLLITCTKAISVPSRFFYDNQEPRADLQLDDNETTSNETKSQPTNLKLLGEHEGEAISIEFLSKLDNVTDFEQFVDLIMPKDTSDGILGKNSKRNVERALVRKPNPANCIPTNSVVSLSPLNPSQDPRVIYLPKCTRVKRCSGCCNSELMSCQPTVVEAVNFELIIVRENNGQAQFIGKDVAVVEEHKSCRCLCRIKEHDCNSLQIYNPEQCRCTCTNDDEREKCIGADHKIWDDKSCRCVCRESDNCTTGTIFDENQCECVDPGYKKVGTTLEERKRFIVKAVAVNPDNSTYYDAA